MGNLKLHKVNTLPDIGSIEPSALYMVPDDPGEHKAWRIHTTNCVDENNTSTQYIAIAELSFVGAENTASYFQDSYQATYDFGGALDGNTTTQWLSQGASVHYGGVILAAPRSCTSVTIQARSSADVRSPSDFTIQYSDDTTNGSDGTWTDALTATGEINWSPLEVREFVIPQETLSSSSYKAWRVNTTATEGGDHVGIAELSLPPGGTMFASSTHISTTVAGAFDNDLLSAWAGDDGDLADGAFIGKIYTSGVSISSINITARDNYPNIHLQAPKDFIIQGSNDTTTGADGVWVDLLVVTNEAIWAAGETRNYVVPGTSGNMTIHASNAAGDALYRTLNQTDIDDAIANVGDTGVHIHEVVDLAARDALSLIANSHVDVLDTTGDPDTVGGRTLYFYHAASDSYSIIDPIAQPVGLILEEW